MATTLRPRADGAHATPAPPLRPGPVVAVLAPVIAVAVALVLPDLTAAGRMTTTPTHYMGLLMANQPWNLLIFMVVPFVLIYGGLVPAKLGLVPPSVGQLVTPVLAAYYTAAAFYLIRYAAWPLTTSAGWRGPADWIAVVGYIATAVPILGLTVATFTSTSDRARNWWFYAVVVLAHVAMSFGMLAPFVLGWAEPGHAMHGM
jgi:Family of unknown function (DUF6803)